MSAQIILLILFGMDCGISLARHGKKKEDTYSFWWSLLEKIILIWILSVGGFFKSLGF